jgi:membrane protease YdiL (CAAX protease family)
MVLSFRLIAPSPRSSVAGAGCIIIAGLVLTTSSFLADSNAVIVLVSIGLLASSLLSREIQAIHISLFTAFLIIVPFLFSYLRQWPFNLLIPLFLYGAICATVPALRRSMLWLRLGRVDKKAALMIVSIAAVSGLALYIWQRSLAPDLSIHLKHIPAMPIWMFPLTGLAFSLGNAAVEEAIYRGVIMQAMDSAFGPGIASVLVQGWLFGAMHYLQGFPNGGWGLVMATAYGIMLGWLRRRSQGMLAPWLAHVCADIVIFVILATSKNV